MIIVLFSIPAVQTQLAKIVTKEVNKSLGINLVIKKLDLSFLGSVQLKGIEIRDHHKDTLIFVNRLSTSLLNAKKILENQVDLGSATLEGVNFHLKNYKGEKEDNLSVFLETFEDGKPKDPKSTPFVLKTSNIYIDGLNFKLIDLNKKDSLEFSALNGGGNLQDFSVVGPNVYMKIRGLYFTENRGVKVTNITTDFTYTKTKMLFKNALLETNNKSKVKADIKLSYKRKDLADFNDKVNIDATFHKSALSIKDLKKFYNELSSNDLLTFTGSVNGVLNNFSVNKLNMYSKRGMKIKGNLGFVNVLNTDRGFVFDGDIENVTANYQQLKNTLPNLLGKTLPTEFRRLGNFTLSGLLKVTPEQMEATLAIDSEIGTTISDLQLTEIDDIDHASYSGEVEFIDFDLGKFTNDPILGKITLQADVSGSGFSVDNINTIIIGEVDNLDFNGYNYKKLSVNGQFQNKKFDGLLHAKDENFKLEFEGLADFSSEINKFDFKAKIAEIDLKKTNLFTRDSISKIKGNVKLDISGNTLDNIVGKATFNELIYTNQKRSYPFKNFSVISSVKDSIKTIKVASADIVNGELKGKFTFEELLPITENALGSVYTNYEPHPVAKNQYLDFDFTIHNQIVDIFLPQISIGENTRLKGRINSDKNSMKLTFSSPKIDAYGNVVNKLLLRLDNKNPLYNTHLTAAEVNNKFYNIKKLNLLNRTKNDTLFFKSIFKGGDKNSENFNLDFFYTIDELKKSVVGVQKSMLSYKGFDWTINPGNNNNNKVVFDLKKKDFEFSPFLLTSKDQKIEFKGALRDSTYKDLQARFTKVKLESFLPPVDSLKLNGKLNGVIDFKEDNGAVSPKGNLLVEEFQINNFEQGDLALNVTGNNSYEKFDVNLSLVHKKAKNISATGGLDFSGKRPTIDLEVFLKDYQLEAFSPLGEEVLSKLRGRVSGNFTATGFLRNPDFYGTLNFEDAGLKFPYLNVDFDLKGNTTVELEKQQFKLNNVILTDTKHDTEGYLSGSFAHENFEKWFLDLKLNTENLLVLDTKESEEVPYYGTGFIKGDARITGLTSNLSIRVENAKTQPGTVFVIPLSDVKTIDNYKLIRFKSDKKELTDKERAIEDIKGLNLTIFLEVTNDALAQVVIDKVAGSDLKGRGEGNLFIEIDTRGKFNMVGDLNVDEGVYNFKYAGISKPFKVQKGGNISWTGNPLDAELDITAVYRTKANPAQLLDNINSSRKIPIDLYTKITGSLFESKQEFDIKIPNANSTVASELEFVLNDNDINTRTQHFVSLLALGTFYNEDRLGSNVAAGLTGTASEIASSILSNLLNKDGSKFQVGVGYTQGDRGNINNLNTDDQVDVSLATQVSDRVIVNGKVGVPVGTNTQTNVVGEVKVEVLLNEEGTLRGTVFNRPNEIQNNVEEEGYTQGVGISYQVNFNNLSELGQKLGLKKKKKEKKEKEKDTVKVKKNKFVRFKSKKKDTTNQN
ncbi:translocation/assembly module TamB domain-containing protein [Tenacibaculum holothuriorum]|uniref:translocation/assembly module TamB domain-containing protein n=1 Tax=Tenacibaculum holothuriorum TaxID=1635173 RepID=UPI000A329A01|nr:translocation/assembly module TamB [Tenacibaculum holothuriorum]